IGVDTDRDKVAAINSGRSPVSEPGLEEIVAVQVAAGRLRATDDLREAISQTDIALICVGTPSDPDGAVSTDALQRVTRSIGEVARSFGGDGHEVMRLLCLDRKLNISPAYLRPGFAFGGSCLPKDLRALARHAQQQALRIDLLASILASNEEHMRRAAQRVQ